MAPPNYNKPVPGLSYFAPANPVSPGTPKDPAQANLPTLFTPLPIRSKTLRNRIIVAPMCQYSSADSGPLAGALTPYHIATLGHYALKGASLVFIEATGVQPNGRIMPNCPGLWSDAQIDGIKAVADFVHSQGALCGIQLAHAGRKASTVPPFVASRFKRASVRATRDVGGWPEDVIAPSGGRDFTWDGRAEDDERAGFWAPRELSFEEIQDSVQAWADAATRAVRAGVDAIEIHGAHGYLIHQFLSPVTNRRTDAYGGSFEGRTRLLKEIVRAIRAVVPESMPLFLRLSSTEWLEDTEVGKQYGSWDVESTIRLAKELSKDDGIDFLDVSSGGNHPKQTVNPFQSKDYQTKIAGTIRKELRAAGSKMLVGAVGLITEAQQARGIVEMESTTLKEEAETARALTDASNGAQEPMADAILVAREFMRRPEWVLRVAHELGVDVAWPVQFDRVRFARL